MRSFKQSAAIAVLGISCLMGSTAAFADHPAYLRALTDLRAARAHLDRPGSERRVRDEERAVEEIDRAIDEIKRASIWDGKNLNDHPPVDAAPDRVGKLHRALELLDAARADCNQEEDNGRLRGLQGRILSHIDRAHRDVEQALRH